MKKGWIYIFLTALMFVTLEPVSKLIAAEVNPFVMTAIRFVIGGLLLLPFSVRQIRKKNLTLGGKDWVLLSTLGVLCVCVSMPLLQYAVAIADNPAMIAVIFSANSVTTLLLSVVILKEKLTLLKGIAVLVSAVGVVVCALPITRTNLVSVLLAIASAVTFSLYTVLSRRYTKKFSGVVQTGISFFIGGFVLLVALLISGTDVSFSLSGLNIGVLIFLGVFVTGVGYWSFFRAMDVASVMGASFVFFIKPVMAPFATWIINGVVPGVNVFLALVLVVIGSVLASVPKEKLLFLRGKAQ